MSVVLALESASSSHSKSHSDKPEPEKGRENLSWHFLALPFYFIPKSQPEQKCFLTLACSPGPSLSLGYPEDLRVIWCSPLLLSTLAPALFLRMFMIADPQESFPDSLSLLP